MPDRGARSKRHRVRKTDRGSEAGGGSHRLAQPIPGQSPSTLWVRIETSLARERQAQSRLWGTKRAAGLKDAISNFFAGLSAPQWQALAAAAVAICAVEAGAIAYLAGAGCTGGVPCRVRPESGDKPKPFRFYRIVLGHGHHRGDRQDPGRCLRDHCRRAERGYALPPGLAQ